MPSPDPYAGQAVYRAKAKSSFNTKFTLYLYHLALNKPEEEAGTPEGFQQFSITPELVKSYTAVYYQQPLGDDIRPGLSIQAVGNRIKTLNTPELRAPCEQAYLNHFPTLFPLDQFEAFTRQPACVYCGMTPDRAEALAAGKQLFKKSQRGWKLEIDRKNSNFEYTPDNCVRACYWCNNAKTDEFTHEEFLKVGKVLTGIWEERLKR